MNKTIKIKVEIDEDKNIGVKLILIRSDPMNPEDSIETYHRIMIRPGDNIVAIRAANEMHLAMPFASSGIKGAPWPNIPDNEWMAVEAIVNLLHTPEQIAYRIQKDAEAKQLSKF